MGNTGLHIDFGRQITNYLGEHWQQSCDYLKVGLGCLAERFCTTRLTSKDCDPAKIDALWYAAVDDGFAHLDDSKMSEADKMKLWEVQKMAPGCAELLAQRFTDPVEQTPVQRWWTKDDGCAASSKDEFQDKEEDQAIDIPTDAS